MCILILCLVLCFFFFFPYIPSFQVLNFLKIPKHLLQRLSSIAKSFTAGTSLGHLVQNRLHLFFQELSCVSSSFSSIDLSRHALPGEPVPSSTTLLHRLSDDSMSWRHLKAPYLMSKYIHSFIHSFSLSSLSDIIVPIFQCMSCLGSPLPGCLVSPSVCSLSLYLQLHSVLLHSLFRFSSG